MGVAIVGALVAEWLKLLDNSLYVCVFTQEKEKELCIPEFSCPVACGFELAHRARTIHIPNREIWLTFAVGVSIASYGWPTSSFCSFCSFC